MAENDLKKRTRWAITYICQTRNFTNKSLADILNIAVGNVSQYRSMGVRPSAEFMTKFCGHFGFNEAWFLSGVGEPFPGAYKNHSDVCGPAGSPPAGHESTPPYGTLIAEQKINIEEAVGKAYKVLSSGRAVA